MPPDRPPDPVLAPVVAAIIAAGLMGFMGVLVRPVALSVETVALARFSLGLLFLTGFLLASGGFRQLTFHCSGYTVLSGVFIALGVLCYFKAIRLTTLANAALLLYLGPVLAAAAAAAWLRERLSLASGLWLVMAMLGCALIVGFDPEVSDSTLRGHVFGLLAAVWYALFIVANRRIPADVTLITRAFYQLLAAALVIAPFADFDAAAGVNWLSAVGWLAAIGFFQGFLSVTLMIFALRYLKAYQYGAIAYLEPVVAALAGAVCYGESLWFRQILGGVLILLSGLAQTLLAAQDNNK